MHSCQNSEDPLKPYISFLVEEKKVVIYKNNHHIKFLIKKKSYKYL